MRNRNFIKRQKLKEIDGSAGAYEKWCDAHPTLHSKGRLGDRFDMVKEDVRSTPDSLRDDEAIYANSQPSTPQFLMGEAVSRLAGRQKECYLLTMRDGKSFSEAAKILGIGKGRVQQYRDRAIRFIKGYCEQAMNGGRI